MRKILLGVTVMVAACGGSSKKPEPQPVVANDPNAAEADPELAREQAIQQAREAGVLGALECGGDGYGGSTYGCYGGGFASITGTGDITSGFDDSNIYGGLLGCTSGGATYGGSTYGTMCGGFGYGTTGAGPGGGGTGWGTIGTGRYGTIGHGSGSGYGVGSGRGGMQGRHAGVPSVRIGQPNAQGDLDKAIIRRYIKMNLSKISYCYEKKLLDEPTLQGTVKATFTISSEGAVSASTATGVHADVASCIANVIAAIHFPKPKGGGTVQVSYPFVFKPSGG